MESEQGLAVRVLFAGACRGNFNKLLKRVEKVHNKNGPFDALFCVGNFFSDTGRMADEADGNGQEFMQFLDSKQKMPMRTYILGAYEQWNREVVKRMEEADCNVHCLGKSGILEMQNGLSIAFIGGTFDADHFDEDPSDGPYYTKADITSLRTTAQSRGGDVDFFLSCDWPEHLTRNLPEGFVEEKAELPKGSRYISSLLSVIRPRYHFASQPSMFFSRSPYKNPDLGAGSHVTRFTSLCPFGSMTKQNLFALCLTPAQFMAQEKLCEIPADATEYPFDVFEDRKRFPDIQVAREVAVDDSSCTPQQHGMMSPQQSGQEHWNHPVQAFGLQQPAGAPFDVRSPVHTPQSGNESFGAGVQALLHNIGRGNVFSGLGQMDPNVLQTQSSFGSDSFGRASSDPVQSFPVINGSPMAYTNVGCLSVAADFSPHQMNIGMVNQQPLPQINGQLGVDDLQTLWENLAQNPQLLNAAMSMGLLQTPALSPTIQQAGQNPALFSTALTNFAASQQPIKQEFQHSAKVELDPENMSETALSGAEILRCIKTERSQLPSQDSKRYKRGSLDNHVNVAKDKRKTCFVGHLPSNATRHDVAHYFSQVGEVVHVVKRQGEERDSTWAFVQYATRAERERAIETLNKTRFGDQELVVKPAKDELEFDPNEPVKECWFCLGSPASDKALIVSVGNESYLAIDKGPISDDHVLIIPTNHYPNTLRMSDSCYEEMQLYLKGLRELFASQGRCLLAFERYLQIPRLHGNHTHLSVISIDEAAASQARETFIQRGRMQDGEWNLVPDGENGREAIHDLVGDEEYILVILPDGSKLVRAMFKDVMAELAGIPERADWKACLSCEAEEKMKVEKFKSEFSLFDYPNKS